MIIDVNDEEYRKRLTALPSYNRHNGAFYYAKEIAKNIIPKVETDRNWVLVNNGKAFDHSIVFIHDNLYPAQTYSYLADYDDLILVCGVPQTLEKVAHLGKPVYLPLSIDVAYVKQFEREKRGEYAFAGRPSKRRNKRLPYDCPILEGMPRQQLLPIMAQYKTIYAVGRTAIEARALGCKIGVYDPRFPDPEFWQVLDNKEAAKMLQEALNNIR